MNFQGNSQKWFLIMYHTNRPRHMYELYHVTFK